MNGTPWTPTEIDMLRRLYPHHTSTSIARLLGRHQSSVYSKAQALGLSKSPEFFASLKSGRIQTGQQHPNIVANRFKPGQQPWNKGVKGSTGLHPNCQANHFKKGEMAGAAQHKYVLRRADALDLGHPLAEEAQQAASLLRAQHAEIERKDALLRQAAVHLSRLAMAAGAPTPPGVNVGWIAHYAEQAEKELRMELSQ